MAETQVRPVEAETKQGQWLRDRDAAEEAPARASLPPQLAWPWFQSLLWQAGLPRGEGDPAGQLHILQHQDPTCRLRNPRPPGN